MIVVTGSTGHVGRPVAEELAALGEPMRLLRIGEIIGRLSLDSSPGSP